MKVIVKKLTDVSLMQRACSFTSGHESHAKLSVMYGSEHSPIRTQIFWIEMYEIPTFVSVHLVRHKVGVDHFVRSNREDRGGNGNADRNTPVNHAMLINAQALISMAHLRLCAMAHPQTTNVMRMIKDQISYVDPDLAMHLVPKCEYRNGICTEPKSCGLYKRFLPCPKS